MKGYNPFLAPMEDLHHTGAPRLSFSRTEVFHLVCAVVVLSYAFSFLIDRSGPFDFVPTPTAAVAALAAMSSGFVLHELAHKVVAQRYGHWAEFRARFALLGLSVVAAASTGFLFAMPGAVLIQGHVTPRENGLISIVGPGVNFVIAAAALPFFIFAVDAQAMVPRIFATVCTANVLLAIFNLIPIDPFDGRKVLRWSKTAYAASVLAALGLFAFALTQNAFP